MIGILLPRMAFVCSFCWRVLTALPPTTVPQTKHFLTSWFNWVPQVGQTFFEELGFDFI
jgi:hypothetical protein